MESESRLQVLKLMLTLDIAIDELELLQNKFRCIKCMNSCGLGSDLDWYGVLKIMFENQCNQYLEKLEPIENEHVQS